MGVQGLSTFCSANEKHFDTLLLKNGTVIIDSSSFARSLFEISGVSYVQPDFGLLRARFSGYLRQMTIHNVKIVAFFDGAVEEIKQAVVQKRIEDNIKRTKPVLADIRSGKSPKMLPVKAMPVLMLRAFKEAVEEVGGSAFQSIFEADQQMAAFARQTPDCLGIITSDSDFSVFDCGPQSGWIPTESVRFSKARSYDTAPPLHATIYRPSKLATILGIPIQMLPVVSWIAGNDFANTKTGLIKKGRLVLDAMKRGQSLESINIEELLAIEAAEEEMDASSSSEVEEIIASAVGAGESSEAAVDVVNVPEVEMQEQPSAEETPLPASTSSIIDYVSIDDHLTKYLNAQKAGKAQRFGEAPIFFATNTNSILPTAVMIHKALSSAPLVEAFIPYASAPKTAGLSQYEVLELLHRLYPKCFPRFQDAVEMISVMNSDDDIEEGQGDRAKMERFKSQYVSEIKLYRSLIDTRGKYDTETIPIYSYRASSSMARNVKTPVIPTISDLHLSDLRSMIPFAANYFSLSSPAAVASLSHILSTQSSTGFTSSFPLSVLSIGRYLTPVVLDPGLYIDPASQLDLFQNRFMCAGQVLQPLRSSIFGLLFSDADVERTRGLVIPELIAADGETIESSNIPRFEVAGGHRLSLAAVISSSADERHAAFLLLAGLSTDAPASLSPELHFGFYIIQYIIHHAQPRLLPREIAALVMMMVQMNHIPQYAPTPDMKSSAESELASVLRPTLLHNSIPLRCAHFAPLFQITKTHLIVLSHLLGRPNIPEPSTGRIFSGPNLSYNLQKLSTVTRSNLDFIFKQLLTKQPEISAVYWTMMKGLLLSVKDGDLSQIMTIPGPDSQLCPFETESATALAAHFGQVLAGGPVAAAPLHHHKEPAWREELGQLPFPTLFGILKSTSPDAFEAMKRAVGAIPKIGYVSWFELRGQGFAFNAYFSRANFEDAVAVLRKGAIEADVASSRVSLMLYVQKADKMPRDVPWCGRCDAFGVCACRQQRVTPPSLSPAPVYQRDSRAPHPVVAAAMRYGPMSPSPRPSPSPSSASEAGSWRRDESSAPPASGQAARASTHPYTIPPSGNRKPDAQQPPSSSSDSGIIPKRPRPQ